MSYEVHAMREAEMISKETGFTPDFIYRLMEDNLYRPDIEGDYDLNDAFQEVKEIAKEISQRTLKTFKDKFDLAKIEERFYTAIKAVGVNTFLLLEELKKSMNEWEAGELYPEDDILENNVQYAFEYEHIWQGYV